MRRSGLLLVTVVISVVLSSCSHGATPTCFQPSARPTRVLTPDRYGVPVAASAGGGWVSGVQPRRPSVLVFTDGLNVRLDRRTRLLNRCGGAVCSIYVGVRPDHRTADWIFGVSQRPGSKTASIEQAAVWDIGAGVLIMSNGLRLRLESTAALPSVAQLRSWGTLVSVALDSRGAIRAISHAAGCA